MRRRHWIAVLGTLAVTATLLLAGRPVFVRWEAGRTAQRLVHVLHAKDTAAFASPIWKGITSDLPLYPPAVARRVLVLERRAPEARQDPCSCWGAWVSYPGGLTAGHRCAGNPRLLHTEGSAKQDRPPVRGQPTWGVDASSIRVSWGKSCLTSACS